MHGAAAVAGCIVAGAYAGSLGGAVGSLGKDEPRAPASARRQKGSFPEALVGQCSTAPILPAGVEQSTAASSREREVLRGKCPVEQLVDHRVDVIGAPVLVVEVVGVLPDVERKERNRAVRKGDLGA
jgi:hypothetical protein